MDYFLVLYNHEVFGHGWKYREYGYTNRHYQLNLVPQYGPGGGIAFGTRPTDRIISLDDRIVTISAGVEATQILSTTLRTRFLQRGSMHYREAVLYFMSINDLPRYTLVTRYLNDKGDPYNYLIFMNTREGFFTTPTFRYNSNALFNQSLVTFLNPFQYYSIYAMLKTYLWSGEKMFEVPMLDVLGVKYLPSMGFSLTPFDGEYHFENLIVHSGKIFNVDLRYGDPTFHKFWGIGISESNLIRTETLLLTASAQVWNQPGLLLGGSTVTRTKGGLGGAVYISSYYDLRRMTPIPLLTAQVGYETTGYLEGESLGDGFIWMVGISFVGE